MDRDHRTLSLDPFQLLSVLALDFSVSGRVIVSLKTLLTSKRLVLGKEEVDLNPVDINL